MNNYIQFSNACASNDILTAERLISKTNLDECGIGELIDASNNGYIEIVKLLLINGVNIDSKNNTGETALSKSLDSFNKEMIQFLLNMGANINTQDYFGDTPVILAVRKEFHDGIEILIKNGADLSIKNTVNKIPLDMAIENRDYISMVLLDINLLNYQDRLGETLLLKSCTYLNEKVILFLYEKGADFFIQDNGGHSAFDQLSLKRKLPDSLQALKEKLILQKSIDYNDEFNFGL